MLKRESLDRRIVELLQGDGRQSSNVLAKQLGVSSATVRRRIKKMVQSGLLRIVGLVDPDKAGFPFVALVCIDVVHNKLDAVLKALSARPEVIWVAAITGRFDVIAIARFSASEDFSLFLREELARIDGIKDSETFLCLSVEKGRYQPVFTISTLSEPTSNIFVLETDGILFPSDCQHALLKPLK